MSRYEAGFFRLAPLADIQTHTRYIFTLRSLDSSTTIYHSLLLFRLSKDSTSTSGRPDSHSQMYVMEASCPHLGADLSHAEIEDYEDEDSGIVDKVAVCPWHRYDFNLRTGESDTGLRACTYRIDIRAPESGDIEEVWVEAPDAARQWELVNLRPVSEDFADPPKKDALPTSNPTIDFPSQDPVVPETDPPKSLVEWAILILNTGDPSQKVARTRHAQKLFATGDLTSIGRGCRSKPPEVPPRPNLKNVDPGKVAKRGKAGSLKNRVAMLHALANIEQWAIDLAWDIIARFASTPNLPHQFFTDFAKVALDESKHFSLLSSRLASLGTPYGTLPVHSALWDSALKTSHSLRSRLAIIHLVHEARGLDVNPSTISKFRKSGDSESVEVLEIIHADEVTHVTAGHRWFTWLCAREGEGGEGGLGVDPVVAFREEVKLHFDGGLKGPFNEVDRKKAGLTKEFYEGMDLVGVQTQQQQQEIEKGLAAVSLGIYVDLE